MQQDRARYFKKAEWAPESEAAKSSSESAAARLPFPLSSPRGRFFCCFARAADFFALGPQKNLHQGTALSSSFSKSFHDL